MFLLSAAALLPFFLREPQLYDNDSYYHLAIARAFAEGGILDHLPWARFSLMHDGFGDKEVLFHLLLVPFVRLFEPVAGGQVFLSLLLAAVFATLALHARPVLGNWAGLLPFAIAFTSTEVFWRWVRLRPESLSLMLIVWSLWAMGRRSYRWLAALSAVYALSYTAFHALGGLCLLVFGFRLVARRRFEPGLVVAPSIGIGAGLIVHPHFPKNLEIWTVQTFEFFRHRAVLDVGTEIFPNTTDVLLMVNLGWLALLLVLWRSLQPAEPVDGEDAAGARRDATADAFGVAAVVFAGLYLLMSRFSLYAMPLVTLWLCKEAERRGLRVGRWTRPFFAIGRLPTLAAVVVCLAVASPEAWRQWHLYGRRIDAGPSHERIADREAVSLALPEGATVAATWQQTPIYMLWAPQARYLNVLDPVFMAVYDPDRHELQRRLFDGSEPDLPLAVGRGLDSRFLAVSAFVDHDRMRARIAADPRLLLRHQANNRLWEVRPGHNASFLLDWRLAAAESGGPETPYPRLADPIGAALEGFVDTRRFGGDARCRSLRHRLVVPDAQRWWLEISPAGPASVSLAGERILDLEHGVDAILGRGAVFPVDLVAGDNTLEVRTCRQGPVGGTEGFYLTRVPQPEETTG